jgi:hypothetical protein
MAGPRRKGDLADGASRESGKCFLFGWPARVAFSQRVVIFWPRHAGVMHRASTLDRCKRSRSTHWTLSEAGDGSPLRMGKRERSDPDDKT